MSKRREDESIVVADDVLGMANAIGFGNVDDLHQAMTLDSSLKNLLKSVIAESDSVKRSVLLDTLIFHWTGANNTATNGRGPNIDGRILLALENLTAKEFEGAIGVGANKSNPYPHSSEILKAEHNKFK